MKKLKRLEKTYYYMVLRALVCVCACAIYILGLSGCNPDEPKNVQTVTFPISFCLPASEVYGAGAPSLRAFGDPGTTEQFALPQYLYIFIVKYVGSGEEGKATLTNWQVWKVLAKTPTEEQWEKKHYTGAYANVGDSIFQYTEEIILLLNGGSFDGRVYAVASAVPLTLPALTEEESTLADVLGMQFSFTGTAEDFKNSNSVVNNLQNIYSTPYNYKYDGEYYGSFFATQNVPHLDLLLYHVAAKVDLMWNVKENLRGDVKISYIAAEHLYDGPCYVFKPTENAPDVSGTDGRYASGYKKAVVSNLNVGTQWNGRAYFYTIPYKNSSNEFPLQVEMLKNGDSPEISPVPPADKPTDRDVKDYYHLIQNTSMPADAVFLPWIRCQMKINKELEYSATPDVFPKLAP